MLKQIQHDVGDKYTVSPFMRCAKCYKKQTPKATGTAYEENSDSEVNTKGDFDDVHNNSTKTTGTTQKTQLIYLIEKGFLSQSTKKPKTRITR